jgi:hypothetical protein
MHDFIDIFAFYVNQISMHNIRNIKKRKSMTYDFQHTKLSKSGVLGDNDTYYSFVAKVLDVSDVLNVP